MDCRIPGLPHSVVKHAQSTSVRELIQKIESHPARHALQQDLRQNLSFNPLSPESKQMIQDVGNIELCELLETEPKTQCTVCLSYCYISMLYCTCGHFLHKERGANQQFVSYHSLENNYRFDVVQIYFFELNLNCNGKKFPCGIFSYNLRFCQICAFVLLVSTMHWIRAWCDDLVVVLFEFLDHDRKLAQSCTDWLNCSTGTPSSRTLQCT